ncbi:c-type cytochrome [Aliiroseovarius subalbicans]|uniref:c-type cytochrome n=1 Tax=Aliiroseovarius subalbicans TaxID=2925840 RepID=UPI001F567D61|nr:c-type cytochrome [Aliiroseovarius subalbicans]MCI2399403.1 cytochrome c [Aliiroseovarius subalbicans]
MLRITSLSLLAAFTLTGCNLPPQTGEELFAANCAVCHGSDAKGGGMELAEDLTTLTTRHGGTFPTAFVMSTIDGYAKADTHGPMPEFGVLLKGDMEVWTDPNGVPTPTPSGLLKLANYLESIQG